MPESTTRRTILAAGLGSAASLVAGCMTRNATSANNELPGPVWPHDAPRTAQRPTRRPRPRPAATEIRVEPRNTWTAAQPIVSQTNPMVRVERITVHHDGIDPVTIRSKDQAADRIEFIRNSHVEGRGWADIGYHYIIDPHGRVWEGRPIRLQGAHAGPNNPRNAGVLVLGHFNLQQPTPQAKNSLDATLAELARLHRVRLNNIHTHQELSATECPGEYLQRHMNQTRRPGGALNRRMQLT
ncbi:MAG: peptidoglycan recognition family protein [Planctomycetota bacterium]